MGDFFFDESIHQQRGGFILGIWIYSDICVQDKVSAALEQNGFQPGVDEFKSGDHVGRNPRLASLRHDLGELLFGNCRAGVVVAPSEQRAELGAEALRALGHFTRANLLENGDHRIFMDQGLFPNSRRAEEIYATLSLPSNWVRSFEQDSRLIGGLQVADLAAHTCSVMLLEELGVTRKLVRAGENSGYEPDLLFELGSEMWTRMRYSFFGYQAAFNEWQDAGGSIDDAGVPVLDVSRYALHISDRCPPSLQKAARSRFGMNYLGCIH